MDLIPGFFILYLISSLCGASVASGLPQLSTRQQSELTLPDCASQCLTNLLPTSNCDPFDTACLCSDATFLDAISICVEEECTVIEALQAQRVEALQLCPQPVRNDSGLVGRVGWPLFGIAIVLVVVRLLSRLPLLGGSGFGWDDGMISLGLALLTPINIIAWLMARDGLGQDVWMLSPNEITNMLYLLWIEEYLYTFLLNVTKISVLLLYLRMFPDLGSVTFRHGCLILIGVLCIHAVAMNLVLTVSCLPVSYSWTFWDGQHMGSCINRQAQIYATAGLNITFDLLVYLLPLPKLLKLSFSSNPKKFAVCLTFLVGLSVTVCSAIRLQYLASYGTSSNLSWNYTPIVIWSIVECDLSVICACIPSLAGVVQRIWAYTSGAPLNSYGRGSMVSPHRRQVRLQTSSMSMQALTTTTSPTFGRDDYDEGRYLESPIDFADRKVPQKWSPTRPLPSLPQGVGVRSHWDDD